MCALPTLLPCPLCAHPHFDRVESLRDKLIFVSTHTLTCPVCQEEMSGLDKLTIHLFSHVKMKENNVLLNSDQSQISTPKCENKPVDKPQVYKRTRTQPTKNKPITSAKAPVKFVKIFPKLPVISLNTMPIIEISQNRLGDNLNNPFCLSTVSANFNNALVSRIETTNTDQYGCQTCGLSFTDEQILKMHNTLIHNANEESSLILEKFPCHLCNKHFKMKGSLMVHLRVAHYGITSNVIKDATTTNCTNTVLESPSTSEMQQCEKLLTIPEKNENKQWFCEVCEKSFTTKYFLKKHKRLHTGETPYACAQCNKTFTFQQSYHKHLLYHNDEKPHSCTFCGRSFKELSTLHNHQRIHTGEKPFSCETCGKCFRQRVSYLVHRRIHTGVMPYKCTACNKSFRYKVSQRTHKCPAQPPGTVVRQSGELLEKLKKKYNENDSISTNLVVHNQDNIYPNISEANAELIRTGAKLSFEDTEADNFRIIYKSPARADHVNHIDNDMFDITEPNLISHDGSSSLAHISKETEFDDLIDNTKNADKSMPSPSEILKNLCLTNYDEDCQSSKNVQSNSNTSEITVNELNLDVIYKEFNQFL